MVDPFDRLLFVLPIMFTAFGFFLAGKMPIGVLAGITASCFVGDLLIWIKYMVRPMVHPPADVTPLPAQRYR